MHWQVTPGDTSGPTPLIRAAALPMAAPAAGATAPPGGAERARGEEPSYAPIGTAVEPRAVAIARRKRESGHITEEEFDHIAAVATAAEAGVADVGVGQAAARAGSPPLAAAGVSDATSPHRGGGDNVGSPNGRGAGPAVVSTDADALPTAGSAVSTAELDAALAGLDDDASPEQPTDGPTAMDVGATAANQDGAVASSAIDTVMAPTTHVPTNTDPNRAAVQECGSNNDDNTDPQPPAASTGSTHAVTSTPLQEKDGGTSASIEATAGTAVGHGGGSGAAARTSIVDDSEAQPKPVRSRIHDSFKRFGVSVQPNVPVLHVLDEADEMHIAAPERTDDGKAGVTARRESLGSDILRQVRRNRMAVTTRLNGRDTLSTPQEKAQRRLSGLCDADRQQIRARIRQHINAQAKDTSLKPTNEEDEDARAAPSPVRIAIPEGRVRSAGSFWEGVCAPPVSMAEERNAAKVRRRHNTASERNDARRTSRHLATFVVQEARRESSTMARRLSMTRPQRRQSVSPRPEPPRSASEPAMASTQPSSVSPQGAKADSPLELLEKHAADSALSQQHVTEGAGFAVEMFDATVLDPFVLLEERSTTIGEVVTEHVQMLRQAVWLMRDFLRLVCQVSREHSEARRVLEETEENMEAVTQFPTSLGSESTKEMPLCLAVAAVAECLAWFAKDATSPSLAATWREGVCSQGGAVRASGIDGAAAWFEQLEIVMQGILGVWRKYHSPKLRWRVDPPMCDLRIRAFRDMPGGVPKELVDARCRQRDHFNARLRELSSRAHKRTERASLPYKAVRKLGAGAFGQVVLVRDNASQLFACKTMIKSNVVDSIQVEHAFNERNILFCVNSPHIVSLHDYWQDASALYLVLEFCAGGELLKALHRCRNSCFSSPQTQFAAAQMAVAVEYLHNVDVVFRDLKPENVLIDARGNLRLGDFGFAKRLLRTNGDEAVTYTMCGTPDYMAPELIVNNGHTLAVDWWALGVFTYEIRGACTPFGARTEYETYYKISTADYRFPGFPDFSDAEKDFVKKLLKVEVDQRLGSLNGAHDVLAHELFKGLDLNALREQTLESPLLPLVTSSAKDDAVDDGCISSEASSKDEFGDIFSPF